MTTRIAEPTTRRTLDARDKPRSHRTAAGQVPLGGGDRPAGAVEHGLRVIQAGLADQTLFDNEVDANRPGWTTRALVALIPGLEAARRARSTWLAAAALVAPPELGRRHGLAAAGSVNTAALGGVAVLLLMAAHRPRRQESSAC